MGNQLRLAGCVITNPAGEILLLHRNTAKRTQWEIPGGKIDPGESEAETVVREIKEELKADIRIVKQLGAREFTEGEYTMHYTWFLGEVTGGTPSIGEPETFDDLRAFSRAGMRSLRAELSGNAQNFLDAWEAAEFTLTSD
ncbi:MAG: hydrolase [Patescibacteria group bacterium]|nr:hydrolase [Patescibacteria group bacterium]